jgi:hypothetical protein
VDWSSLDALNEKKFGGIGIAFTKCTVPNIPYTLFFEWFRRNIKLVDEPGTPFPEGRESKRPRRLGRATNDMKMVIEEAFTNIDNGGYDLGFRIMDDGG